MTKLRQQILDRFPFETFFRETLQIASQTQKELRAHCPFHEDKKASFSACYYGERKGLVKCFSCNYESNIFGFIGKVRDLDSKEAFRFAASYAGVELQTNKNQVPYVPPIRKEYIEKMHQDLLENPEFDLKLNFLKEQRGLTIETIKKFKFGYTKSMGGKYSIPIFGPEGQIWTVRYYAPGNAKYKFYNHMYKDENGVKHSYKVPNPCFTDWEWLKTSQSVIICAGELDAAILWQNDFCSFTEITGESSWSNKNNHLFKDKFVVIAYDNDKTGRTGAENISHRIINIAKKVAIFQLPPEVEEGGDITDYFVKLGRTQTELRQELKNLKPLENKLNLEPIKVDPNIISLNDCLRKNIYYNQYNRFQAQVTGVARDPLTVPKTLKISCEYTVSCKSKSTCPILWAYNCGIEFDLTKKPDIFYLYIAHPRKEVENQIKQQLGLGRNCKQILKCSEEVVSVTELQVTPRIITGKRSSSIENNSEGTVFFVGEDTIRENACYTFTGKPEENPKNHKTAIISYEAVPEQNELDGFKVTPEILERLQCFKKPENISAGLHVSGIAKDISTNICKMVGTYSTAYAILLTTFSPQDFQFAGEDVNRGWANTLVIGDTGTGKSASFERFNEWCKCAEIINGETISLPGLIGGLAKGHSQTMVRKQGVLGRNDRRMVFWDEFKEADKDIISMLTGVRSEGIIRYSKIEQWSMFARTRILMYTSPKGNTSTLASYNPPIKAISPIFNHSREDIRRTDYVFLLHADEVPVEKINTQQREVVEHKYKIESFRDLILYAWNGNANNIWFHPDTEKLIFQECLRLGEKYSDKIPLIDPKSYRFKLARAAITFAYLCFSTNQEPTEKKVSSQLQKFDKGELLEVYPEHVKGYLEFFESHMDNSSVGFYELALQENKKTEKLKKDLDLKELFETILPRLKLKYEKFKDIFFSQSIKDFNKLQLMLGPEDYRAANRLIAYLQENHVIDINENKYVKYAPKHLVIFKDRLDRYYQENFESILLKEVKYYDRSDHEDNVFSSNWQDRAAGYKDSDSREDGEFCQEDKCSSPPEENAIDI